MFTTYLRIIFLIAFIILAVGCDGTPSLEVELSTDIVHSATPVSTETPATTATSTSTVKPVLTPTGTPSDLTSSVLPELEQITVENADRVQLIETLRIPDYIESHWHQCNTVFSPDGRFLAGACGKSTVSIWEVRTLQLHKTLYETPKAIVSCEFSPDSRMLACAGFQNRDVTLWDVESGERIERFRCDSNVFDVDFSPDGQRLAAVSVFSLSMNTGEERNGAIHLWDITTGELLWENETITPRSFISVSYHPNGEVIAYGKERGGAGIVDAETGEVLLHFDTDGNYNIGDLTYSPSGNLLAVGKDDYLIYIWDTTDYSLITTLDEHQNYVNGVVFSDDETLLVSGSGELDRTLGIWAVEDFQLLTQLEGHQDSILRIDINPAGTLIASVSWDGTVKLWGIPGGE